jgi:hypothetical protein
MNELVQSGEAKGTIFILDTLKKFTNLMDKTLASEFGNTARSYVTAGGTFVKRITWYRCNPFIR